MKFLEFYVNSSQFMCGFLMAWRKVSMKNFLNFSNLKFSDYEAKKCAFFKMLIQILRLARQIPVPQTHELLMVWEKIFSHFYFLTPIFQILPIFCEALPMYSISQTEESSAILELVLDGLLELLKMAPPEKISEEALKIFLANFSEILSSQEHKIVSYYFIYVLLFLYVRNNLLFFKIDLNPILCLKKNSLWHIFSMKICFLTVTCFMLNFLPHKLIFLLNFL